MLNETQKFTINCSLKIIESLFHFRYLFPHFFIENIEKMLDWFQNPFQSPNCSISGSKFQKVMYRSKRNSLLLIIVLHFSYLSPLFHFRLLNYFPHFCFIILKKNIWYPVIKRYVYCLGEPTHRTRCSSGIFKSIKNEVIPDQGCTGYPAFFGICYPAGYPARLAGYPAKFLVLL